MSQKILIAEDERPMARALELKLKNSGFETKAVFDGREALDEIKKNKYDLLLLDLMMPVLNGFEVLEDLKKTKNKIKVIVSSNLGQSEDINRVKKLGAIDYFVKSDTSISEVIEHVKKALKK